MSLLSAGSPNCSYNATLALTYCACNGTNDSRYLNISLHMSGRYDFYLNSTNYLTYDSVKKQCLFTIIEDTS